MLRVLIVDDEPPARRELRRLLAAYEDLAVVGEADNLADARRLLIADTADVLFLDLRLGRDTGFEVLPAVPPGASVVIVTAYDEYAVRAFETNAIDYLLKPVEPERLAMALARIRSLTRMPSDAAVDTRGRLPDRLSANDWLLLRDGADEHFVRATSVACIIADGDYTRVGTIDGRSRLVHRTLRDWAQRLPPDMFERVHRSALANLRHVLRVERAANYTARLLLRGQPPIAVSRRAAARLRRRHG